MRPGIYGIPLNGSNNTAVIRDTDGGTYDRDLTWDRAVGPMQFIPGTWRTVGVDANGDGRKDPRTSPTPPPRPPSTSAPAPVDLVHRARAPAPPCCATTTATPTPTQVLASRPATAAATPSSPRPVSVRLQRTGSPYLPCGEPQTMASYDAAQASQPAGRPRRPGQGRHVGRSEARHRRLRLATPQPSSTAGGGSLTGTVTDVVGGVVGGLTGSTPTPTPTPTPSTTPSTTTPPPLPLQVLPTNGTCPAGYDPVLNILGITVLCTLHP